ncbi:hypothetical protein LguiA_033120 [Lonicera macranthoides]
MEKENNERDLKVGNLSYNIKDMEKENEERDLELGNLRDNINGIFRDNVSAHIKAMESKLLFFQMHQNYDKFQWASIYKVPEKLRKVNEDAYTPRIFEKDRIHELEFYCRESDVPISIHENLSEVSLHNVERPTTKIFDDPWIKRDILHDLILLENQLPYEIIITFFRDNNINIPIEAAHNYIRTYFKNSGMMDHFLLMGLNDRPDHLVDFLAKSCIPTIRNAAPSRKGKLELNCTATKLQEAGVKFVSGWDDSLLNIQFDSTKGILTIPQLNVSEHTETIFRNLIAFEQCRRNEVQYITSYIILMDSLIDTPEDVELLISCDIIKNLLEDNEQVSNLFNNLPKETILDNKDFYFAIVCEDLNKYRKNWYTQWKASWFRSMRILRRDYLSNTWTIISVIAASILLILTVIQTVCSILQL